MKQYRIVRVAPVSYRQAVLQLYRGHPGLEHAPYALQQAAYFAESYIYADGFSRAMRSLGHEAHEIVGNFERLQKTWAKENGAPYEEGRWETDILRAQLAAMRPDVVYLQGMGIVPDWFLAKIRGEMPFIRCVVQYTCNPGVLATLKNVDVLIAGTPTMVREYRAAGFPTHLSYHSFDEAILKKLVPEGEGSLTPVHDFTFAGSSGYAQGLVLQTRYRLLMELIRRTPLELWAEEEFGGGDRGGAARAKTILRHVLCAASRPVGVETLESWQSAAALPEPAKRVLRALILQRKETRSRRRDSRGGGPRLPEKPLLELFPQRCRPPLFGMDLYRLLARSKVTFNKHTDAALDSVGNMRLFQATGVGACLLTDTGDNMADLFEADQEVVTYRSADECVEKARYLLEHEETRVGIACAGRRRTLRDHTTAKRCAEIDEIIQQAL